MLPEIAETIKSLAAEITDYAEPFAGGAGAAIELLAGEFVESIALNDADIRIFSAWQAILEQTDRFAERIRTTPLDLETWYAMKEVVDNPKTGRSTFELGFATFYMNRTNRSGIITGAGPIGGYAQEGAWKLDARFYRETIAKRVEWIGAHRDSIRLTNLDALEFIRAYLPKDAKRTFFFIDPPYVQMGGRLYFNSMEEIAHKKLAQLVRKKTSLGGWLITYDRADLIRRLYSFASINDNPLQYSLSEKRLESELLIRPT